MNGKRVCLVGVILSASLLLVPAFAGSAADTQTGNKYAPPWTIDAISELHRLGFPGIPMTTEPFSPQELALTVLNATAHLRTIQDIRAKGLGLEVLDILEPLIKEVRPIVKNTFPEHAIRLETVYHLLKPARLEIGTFGEKAFLSADSTLPPLSEASRAALLEQASQVLQYHDSETAISIYRDILAHRSNDPEALTGLALTLAKERKDQQAGLALKRAVDLNPANSVILDARGHLFERQGRYLEAETMYHRLYKLEPDNRDATYSIAWVRSKQGNRSGAISILQDRLKQHPRELETLFLIGKLLLVSGQPDQARYYLRQIQTISPGHPEALVQIAETYLAEDDAVGAHEILNEVPPSHRKNQQYLRVRAATSRKRGHHDQELEYLNSLLALNPDNNNAHQKRAMALVSLERLNEALTTYKDILTRTPNNSDVLREAARLMTKTGDLKNADKTYRRLLSVDSGNYTGWLMYGRLLMKKGDLKAAGRCFHAARELDPGASDAYESLGEIAYRQGNYSNAEYYFSQALSLNPMDATAAWYLSRVFSFTRQYSKAQETLEDFLSFAPGVSFLEEELHLVLRNQRLSADTGYLKISTRGSSDFEALNQRFSGRFRDELDYTASLERMRIWESNEPALHQTNIGLTLGYKLRQYVNTRLFFETQTFSGAPGDEFKYKVQISYQKDKPKLTVFHSIGPLEESLAVIRKGFEIENLGLKLFYPVRPWLDLTLTPSWSRITDGTNQKRTVKTALNCFYPGLPDFRLKLSSRFYAYSNELDSAGNLFTYFAPNRYITRNTQLSWDKKIGRITITLGLEKSRYEYRFLGASSGGGSTGYSFAAQGSFTDELFFVLYFLDSRSDTKTAASDLEPSRSLFLNLSYRL